jgi:hypothetical protein
MPPKASSTLVGRKQGVGDDNLNEDAAETGSKKKKHYLSKTVWDFDIIEKGLTDLKHRGSAVSTMGEKRMVVHQVCVYMRNNTISSGSSREGCADD